MLDDPDVASECSPPRTVAFSKLGKQVSDEGFDWKNAGIQKQVDNNIRYLTQEHLDQLYGTDDTVQDPNMYAVAKESLVDSVISPLNMGLIYGKGGITTLGQKSSLKLGMKRRWEQ